MINLDNNKFLDSKDLSMMHTMSYSTDDDL